MRNDVPVAVAASIVVCVLACSTTVTTTPVSPKLAPAMPSAPPTSVLHGVFTDAQAARGRAAYWEHCAECHGEGLGGDEMAPGLTGVAFSFRWRGLTVADVYGSVQSTMPPEEPGTLSAGEYIDIVAFLLSANRYPAGDRELAADSALLGGIAVERMPP